MDVAIEQHGAQINVLPGCGTLQFLSPYSNVWSRLPATQNADSSQSMTDLRTRDGYKYPSIPS